jgi:hypothetical protein
MVSKFFAKEQKKDRCDLGFCQYFTAGRTHESWKESFSNKTS